jgi:coenzyme F420-reducing hydrogenase gamma subunit
MPKPKVAFFDFACCEGCQLQVANLGEQLLDVLAAVEVVEFREVMSEKWNQGLDVAIVEGSITDEHAVERIRRIRAQARILVAYGSCATIGGVNGMKNRFPLADIQRYVYGQAAEAYPTQLTRPVHQVVPVDYFVPGCPVYPPEFLKVLKAVLTGNPYEVPDYAVCVECKLNENVCMYDRGITCLGPVTRAGCNSWCLNNNNICYGCRGQVTNPNINSAQDVIRRYRIQLDLILNKLNMYNQCLELETNAKKL